MIVIGVLLFLVGWLLNFPYHHGVMVIGAILFVVGLLLFILGYIGRPVGGRKYWY